ncbi:GCN5-related N-acetyltransferase [Pirellula staleyi DSM 6068]|uniref:GCN5-related N-acetyltransferase n=1 Tax=Pirellula staleyi (strain ATCC 27377 / DSM 6068 / ICPB 4128) TaxID=530564 RepID=D2QYE8_PIRSD|nr:GNAT family N-acetyltransferase [Pirellula staleyi]ADB16362.1 GCN5-related N-acetyltransferase [Pirellula staleyi DSM 6068]
MGVTYFKRFRMEIDLPAYGPKLPALSATAIAGGRSLAPPPLAVDPALASQGYSLLAWSPKLIEAHSDVKFRSFRFELDANVFPCLGDREGCYRLMGDIVKREGFVPQATWLAQCWPDNATRPDLCGTIQGISDGQGLGAVQNIGVTPTHRGKGIGSLLVRAALQGFAEAGCRRVFLEVTAQNTGAVRLYERLGFRITKTVYKASEVAYA